MKKLVISTNVKEWFGVSYDDQLDTLMMDPDELGFLVIVDDHITVLDAITILQDLDIREIRDISVHTGTPADYNVVSAPNLPLCRKFGCSNISKTPEIFSTPSHSDCLFMMRT